MMKCGNFLLAQVQQKKTTSQTGGNSQRRNDEIIKIFGVFFVFFHCKNTTTTTTNAMDEEEHEINVQMSCYFSLSHLILLRRKKYAMSEKFVGMSMSRE
jgi:hypothetical protein